MRTYSKAVVEELETLRKQVWHKVEAGLHIQSKFDKQNRLIWVSAEEDKNGSRNSIFAEEFSITCRDC